MVQRKNQGRKFERIEEDVTTSLYHVGAGNMKG